MQIKSRKILVVDDEKNLREALAELIESEGFQPEQAADGAEALLKIRAAGFACIFLDIRMPRMDGLQLLAKLREENLTAAPVIVVSAFGESDQTIEAMRLGAFDYITKPLDIDEILQTLKRAVRQFEASRQDKLSADEGEAESNTDATQIIGTSRRMREVFKQIGRVAATDATVLITGESGTGKELAARAIHDYSARAGKPFVAVNCGAIPETLIESELFGYEKGAFTGAVSGKKGLFEAAGGGTIFLDEIGEMPLQAQVKLLRVLQERKIERVGGSANLIPVDVRVIAATNRDLTQEIARKNFREDLFYRLNVVEIHLPPLRERLADVPPLAKFFLGKAVRKHRLPLKIFSDTALRFLLNLDFPGNVRELENIVERAAVASGTSSIVLPEHFAAETGQQAEQNFLQLPFKESIALLEKTLIENALREAEGNRSEAARRLGINRRLLYDKIEEHKIKNER
ncbi:MAG TPA: sigma-54 dependent transcriptional regulator [Pyrinomonadaceae bacterium]|jgi:two-component system response regulator AtoC